MHIHPLVVRITHWTNAAAMTVMIGSGWHIYNASPLFPFVFPPWLTVGGWLGGALAWHFAAMWLLAGNLASISGTAWHRATSDAGCCRCALARSGAMPCWPCASGCRTTVRTYNAVQRLLYVSAGCGLVLAIVSGLAIWKPVQLYPLTFALGGYEIARRVHFLAMAGLVGLYHRASCPGRHRAANVATDAHGPRSRVDEAASIPPIIAAASIACRGGCSCAARCR